MFARSPAKVTGGRSPCRGKRQRIGLLQLAPDDFERALGAQEPLRSGFAGQNGVAREAQAGREQRREQRQKRQRDQELDEREARVPAHHCTWNCGGGASISVSSVTARARPRSTQETVIVTS